VTTVLQWTGRESRIWRQARRVSVAAFAAHPGAASVSGADWARPAGLIRLCDETPRILDTVLRVSDMVRARFEAAPAGPMAAGRSADERDQHLTCVLAHQDHVDLVTIAHLGEMVTERAWK
jgi:hypothetical protein